MTSSPHTSPRGDILIADDTLANLRLLSEVLTKSGYKVRGVPNGTMALRAARSAPPDLILLDINMPDMRGYEVCRHLKKEEALKDIPVIFISALDDIIDKVKAFSIGGIDYITKPFQVDEVLARVRTHLTLRRLQLELKSTNHHLEERVVERTQEIARLKAMLEVENAYLREEVREAGSFGSIIGQSPAIQAVNERIALVAPTDATVLIQGESGTGKELVAREIHRRSSRANKPLIRVNCGSIPGELFESEFFGHKKGAFTGASEDRIGRFAAADNGTLFLDEVGEIRLDLQAKLLRVLQEGQFERVGDNRVQTANVRIVAATNRDLEEEVTAGRFRRDLYYRLNVFPIQVPPLRDRQGDIPLLATHYLESTCRRIGVPLRTFAPPQLEHLDRYDWPGNVRELQNIIERAVILSQSGELRLDGELPLAPQAPSLHADQDAPIFTFDELQQIERQNVLRALDVTAWRIGGEGGTAELLGVKPSTLRSRIKAMGLKKP
ncbi:MAG: sigma-54 dependent transcriptional regulator [Myxococcota bacterium]